MPVTMRSEDGRVISVDETDVRFYADRGFVAETPESEFARFKSEAATIPDRGLLGTLNAGGTSLLSGATLGLSDVAFGAGLDDSERKRLLAERAANPVTSVVGNVVGTIAPALLAPGTLLGKAPAGYLGRAAAEGFQAGRAAGGIGGAARAAAYTGAEGAVQNAGAYLADVALGDRQLSAEGLSGALGTGFAFGSAAGAAILGIEKGSIAARRMFARTAEGGEQAAQLAEETWKTASRETIQANDTAAEIARNKLTEAREATTRARVAQQQAKAGEIDARAAMEAEAREAALGPPPSPAALQTEAERLGPLVAEYDAAKAEFDDILRRLQAPDIEPGIVPQTPGVPVGEFGAPGARGYSPGEVKAPGPPSVVEAKTGDVTAVGRKKFGQGTPVAERQLVPANPFTDEEYAAYKKTYSHSADSHYESEMRYSKGGDEVVNPALRSGKPLEGEALTLRDGLDAAFAEAESRIPRELTLYRGLSDNPILGQKGIKERFANVKPGDVLEDPAYTSTAFSEKAKSRNEDVVFTIHAPAGTPALPLRTHYSFEGEMLLPRGTRMRVDSIEYVPVNKRWKMEGVKHEVLPDGSVKEWVNDGPPVIRPPIKDIHVTIINDFAPPARGLAPSVDLSSPIDQLSRRQLGRYRELLDEAFDKAGRGTPEYERLLKVDEEVVARRRAFSEGKLKDVPDWTPPGPAPAHATDTLTGQLRSMQSKLGAGEDLKAMGAPARAEYAAQKAAKTEEAAAHFMAKATGSDLDPFFANLTRPKTRDAYVAQNIGAAMRSEGSHAAGLAKLEREWAEMSGHPLSVKSLEQRLDDATERAVTATDPVERAAAQAEAQSVERQLTLVGARPGAVEDIAAVAKVATRYEKASAEIAEALGDAAPPAAKQAAKAFRDAETDTERKMMDRATRAVEDHIEAQPTAKERFASARSKRVDADVAVAKARAAEGEAKLGDVAARRAAKESKQAASTVGLPVAPTPAGSRLGGLADIGAVLEVASTAGIPGLPSPHDIPFVGPLLGVYLKYRALKAAAGRFVGRVPVTGEARAATLAAKTKDKIAVAVDRSLGLVAKAAPRARAPVVALTEVLQRRAFDDGEPDAPKNASLTKRAAVRIREVTAAATRPDLVVAQVRRELAGISDPDLIAAVEKHRIAIYQYLNKVAPELPQANPYTKVIVEPSPAAAMKFARQVEAAFDPASVFEALYQQTLTPEAAETLRATSPKLFGMAQERLLSRAGDLTEPVPYKQCVRAGLLFDVPLHPSMQADNAAVLQSVHEPKSTAPPATPPMSSIAGNTNLTNLYQPGLDRRSAMR